MNIAGKTSTDVSTNGGGMVPPSTGPTPDALPEVQMPAQAKNLQTGVSTKNVPLQNEPSKAPNSPHWYAIRCAYGREQEAYAYIIHNKGKAYCPTIKARKVINGRCKTVEESYIPNIFFIHGTFDEVKAFVYDNHQKELKPLRFYYCHRHINGRIEREPLIVPDHQMESLRIICASQTDDILLLPGDIQKFQEGQTVRVTAGKFSGIIGKVARYQGQQRVAVIINGLITAVTAYVPRAFLEQLI